jgi:hypothetical protein
VATVTHNTVRCRFTRDADRRFSAWEGLWTKIALDTYDPAGSVASNLRRELLDLVVQLGEQAGPQNRWGEDMMRETLWHKDKDAAELRDFIGDSVPDRPCQSVIDDATQKVPALRPFAGLQCAAVWQRYRSGVRALFDADGANKLRQPLGDPFEKIYVDDPLDRVPPPRKRR